MHSGPISPPRILVLRTRRDAELHVRLRDKGPARWHRADRLFLGIDHTAIVVGGTEASLRFYRDSFGLTLQAAVRTSGLNRST